MNPDILFFSDPHLHERKEFSKLGVLGLNSRLEEGLDILGQIARFGQTIWFEICHL